MAAVVGALPWEQLQVQTYFFTIRRCNNENDDIIQIIKHSSYSLLLLHSNSTGIKLLLGFLYSHVGKSYFFALWVLFCICCTSNLLLARSNLKLGFVGCSITRKIAFRRLRRWNFTTAAAAAALWHWNEESSLGIRSQISWLWSRNAAANLLVKLVKKQSPFPAFLHRPRSKK